MAHCHTVRLPLGALLSCMHHVCAQACDEEAEKYEGMQRSLEDIALNSDFADRQFTLFTVWGTLSSARQDHGTVHCPHRAHLPSAHC